MVAKKIDEQRKRRLIAVRVTQEEWERIQRESSDPARRMSKSEYIRSIIFRSALADITPADVEPQSEENLQNSENCS